MKPEKEFTAAVIGLGWAGQQHLKGYLAQQNVRVVGIAEPVDALRESVTAEYSVPRAYADFRELLEREKPDLVSVATPNFAHAEPVIAALNAGAHVLVEKPLARTYAEGLSMVKAAERNDRVMQVTFNQRYRPDAATLKRFVDEGGVGEIYHAKARWLRRSGVPGGGLKWFSNRELSGGGPLIDLGVHMLDLALHVMGEPKVHAVSGATYDHLGPALVARSGNPDGRFEVEDFATSLIRLEGGKTLMLEASWATYREDGDLMNLMVYGTSGGAEMASKRYATTDSLRFYVDAGGVPAEIHPEVEGVSRKPGHQLVVEEFLSHIAGNDWANNRGRKGLLRTWIIDAIYRSAAEGKEITLGELAEDEVGTSTRSAS
jgi:predicted dehydrogenase